MQYVFRDQALFAVFRHHKIYVKPLVAVLLSELLKQTALFIENRRPCMI